MASRRALIFRVVGFALVALAFLSSAGKYAYEVLAGRGSETYTSVRGFSIPYAAALVSVVAIVSVALVVGVVRTWKYMRRQSGDGGV